MENQLNTLQKIASLENWNVIRVYQDHASGKSSDREAFQRMLADAHKKRFDILLFWSLDRLSREGVLPTLNLLNRLSAEGIQYRSHTETYLDSCGIFKDVVLSLLATLAKQERIRISERTKAGMARKAEQVANGTARPGPKGYLKPGKPPVEFDKALAAELRMKDHSYAEIAGQLGVSKTTIARFFNSPNA